MTDTKRPWQGTALAVIDIIGVVFAFLAALAFMFFQGFISQLMSGATAELSPAATGVLSMLQSYGLVFGIIFIGIGILAIFMANGAFKGQKWSPILSIIFAILGLLGVISSLSQGYTFNSQLTNIIVQIFILYCAIVCVKAPFYSKK